jgi:hypothetical protein
MMSEQVVGYAVRTFFGSKGTHSVPYHAVHQRLLIPVRLGWLKQIFLREKGRAGLLIPNSGYLPYLRAACFITQPCPEGLGTMIARVAGHFLSVSKQHNGWRGK